MIKKILLATMLLTTFSFNVLAEEKNEKEEKTEKKIKPFSPNISAFTRKSLLSNNNVSLGGYFDTEYFIPFGKKPYFDQHRLVLQASALYNERIFFNTEIELEHGGIFGNNKGEIKIEQAFLDYKVSDWLTFRSGIILMPLGRLNIYHDSDIRQTTSRPLFNTYIVPSTWMDTGAGFYGSISSDDTWELNYDLYVTQGLTDKVSEENGLKDARSLLFTDNNSDKAISGRLGFSPFLGLEAGLSGYTGKVDNDDKKYLGIGALDFKYNIGSFEILGEGGMVFMNQLEIPSSEKDKPSKIIKNPMYGYFVEGRYKFFPDFLKSSFLGNDFENANFTLFGRVDQVDTDIANLNGNDKIQFTVGMNYRPITNVVFKLEYQMNKNTEALLKNDASKQKLEDKFLLSVAAGF